MKKENILKIVHLPLEKIGSRFYREYFLVTEDNQIITGGCSSSHSWAKSDLLTTNRKLWLDYLYNKDNWKIQEDIEEISKDQLSHLLLPFQSLVHAELTLNMTYCRGCLDKNDPDLKRL